MTSAPACTTAEHGPALVAGNVPASTAAAAERRGFLLSAEPALVDVADIQAAQRLLAGVARVTPLHESPMLSRKAAGPVLLKCENLQRTGSFKLRGAYVRIARMDPRTRARGVVAASAGNHAQGVALAAALLGCRATVFMPETAPPPKVAATRGYGATVRLAGASVAEALAAAAAFAAETGSAFVHPFDDADIIAGQGTVGLEILDQCPDVATVVVPCGGGGLLSGVAAAIKASRPRVRVVGVQAKTAAAMSPSLGAGHPVTLPAVHTIADGIAVNRPGDVTLAHVSGLVDEVITVSDEAILSAVLFALERARMVAEPAGAAGIAAVMQDPGAFEPPVVVVVSGANIDPVVMLHALQARVADDGRYVAFRARVPDRPGALSDLLAKVARTGVNVLDVGHVRTVAGLRFGEAEVEIRAESRDRQHATSALAHLRDEGCVLVSAQAGGAN
jgi:threonine dehydratase